jgi:hypothetical protein
MEKRFSIKTSCFSLYKAFREEAEMAGWKYNGSFNPFEEERMQYCNCLFFSTEWDHNGMDPRFSFSNSSTNVFQLPEQWNEAIDCMKKAIITEPENKKFTLSLKDLAAHHGINVEDITIIA